MIVNKPEDIILDDIFMKFNFLDSDHVINIKIEGLSITNSIKIKSAINMIEKLEKNGKLKPGGALIESSSGNLGLALSMICASRNYKFTCITDPNISPQTASLITAYGTELIVIKKRDENGGFLGTRIKLINKMLNDDPNLIWINQYSNPDNPDAHYTRTAPKIFQNFSNIDYLFIGAGTTGTLVGVSQYFKKFSPNTQIIAVDTKGSVTFGQPAGPRFIPGLGTSTPPPISKGALYDRLLMIEEAKTVQTCRDLAKRGILLGGSSGTVLAGVQSMLSEIRKNAVIVAISPDMGDRYINTVYSDSWVSEKFPTLH